MNRMKELREEKGLTMKEAASRMGLPYTTYVNYEKGAREPNSEMLIALAKFYNCSIDYLIGHSEERVDEAVLDQANGIDTFLLAVAGNIMDAEKLQEMIDRNEITQAREFLLELQHTDADIPVTAYSDTDPQIDEIIKKCEGLTAQTLEKVKTYIDDLRYNPASKKEKPSTEGKGGGQLDDW